MPWKTDESGVFVKDDKGNPIFVYDGGEEKAVDVPAMSTALTKANREAAERKEKIRSLEAQVKAFEGIEDVQAFIAKAKKDADAVAAFDDKQKTVEETTRARIEAATAPLNAKIKELETTNAATLGSYHKALIDAQFGTSKYVNEELVNSAMVKELFARHFSVDENGKIVAKDGDGKVVYDQEGPANFESALRLLVAASPYKEFVLKGNNASGSGVKPNNGGNKSNLGQKVMSRADFDKLDPVSKAARMKEGYTLVD